MDARETPLILPGMEIAEPGDTSFFLGGAYVAQYDRVRSVRAGVCGAVRRRRVASPCPPQPPVAEARQQAVRQDHEPARLPALREVLCIRPAWNFPIMALRSPETGTFGGSARGFTR